MHFEDLTPYTYTQPDEPGPQPLNVGWLGDSFDFPVADPFPPFLAHLGALCRTPVELMRGFHVCQLCGFDPMYDDSRFDAFLGNGEIRVEGSDGTIYAAPVMIYHYVRDHRYAPPAAFREAVMMRCRHCGGRLEHRIEGRTQGLRCSSCGERYAVTSYFPPIETDGAYYTLTVAAGDPRDKAHIKAIAALANENFLRARSKLATRPVLRLRAQPLDVLRGIAILDAVGLAYAIEPAFPYTQADSAGTGTRYSWGPRRIIDGDEVPAPPVAANPQDRLETPETYPGLPAAAATARALLVVRYRSLMPSSAYALLAYNHAWTLRRVEVGHDPTGLLHGLVSYGADATFPQTEARGFLAEAGRLRRLDRPVRELMLDGPDRYAVHLGAERYDYLAEEDAFAAECAMIETMIAAFDRLLPASTLRERYGRW